jgi:hypothetical protein
MASYYLGLRHAHICFAILSITLFAVRGSLMLAESPRLQSMTLRILPHVIDTMLLMTALMLTTVIHPIPFQVRMADDEGGAAGHLHRARQQSRSSAAVPAGCGSLHSSRHC